MLRGYSASFQGRPDRADAYFEEAINVDVPPRTYSPNKALEARAAFRRGNRGRAFRVLRAHVEELLATDNMQAGSLVGIEFINMMVNLDHLAEAGRVFTYLGTTGLLDTPAWRTLVADSASKLNSHADTEGPPKGDLDDRQALEGRGTEPRRTPEAHQREISTLGVEAPHDEQSTWPSQTGDRLGDSWPHRRREVVDRAPSNSRSNGPGT